MADSNESWYVRLPSLLCYWRNWRGRCKNPKHEKHSAMRPPVCDYADCPTKCVEKVED